MRPFADPQEAAMSLGTEALFRWQDRRFGSIPVTRCPVWGVLLLFHFCSCVQRRGSHAMGVCVRFTRFHMGRIQAETR